MFTYLWDWWKLVIECDYSYDLYRVFTLFFSSRSFEYIRHKYTDRPRERERKEDKGRSRPVQQKTFFFFTNKSQNWCKRKRKKRKTCDPCDQLTDLSENPPSFVRRPPSSMRTPFRLASKLCNGRTRKAFQKALLNPLQEAMQDPVPVGC